MSGYAGAVATGHRGFAVLNRAVNPLVGLLLRSPLHRLVNRRLALITYTGRRTGRRHTIPVGYGITGREVTITVGAPERKVWWRSLTDAGARVELVVRGRRQAGHAIARRNADRALVRVALDP